MPDIDDLWFDVARLEERVQAIEHRLDTDGPPAERIDPHTPLGEGADMITSVHDALKGKEPIIARWMVYLVMAEAIRQRVLQRAEHRPSGTERPDYAKGPEQFEEARDGE